MYRNVHNYDFPEIKKRTYGIWENPFDVQKFDKKLVQNASKTVRKSFCRHKFPKFFACGALK